MKVAIHRGFPRDQRARAAALYWQAFRGKLGRVMAPDERAVRFLESVLDPRHAIGARDASGKLVGLAGFKTRDGAMVGGSLDDLRQAYGVAGAFWRGPLLSMLDRELQEDALVMDGICVSAKARGQGVGSALLDAIKHEAAARGCAKVLLDVIDSNPRAEQLYRRHGFQARGREHLGPVRFLFGFNSALRMEFTVPSRTEHAAMQRIDIC